VRKSGNRFCAKTMRKQKDRAALRIPIKSAPL
jgi:hypothetical protein